MLKHSLFYKRNFTITSFITVSERVHSKIWFLVKVPSLRESVLLKWHSLLWLVYYLHCVLEIKFYAEQQGHQFSVSVQACLHFLEVCAKWFCFHSTENSIMLATRANITNICESVDVHRQPMKTIDRYWADLFKKTIKICAESKTRITDSLFEAVQNQFFLLGYSNSIYYAFWSQLEHNRSTSIVTYQ